MKTLPSFVLIFAAAAAAAFVAGAITAAAGLVSLSVLWLGLREYSRPIPSVIPLYAPVAVRPELRSLRLAA